MILLRQMIVLFLIMLIGYGLAKRKILDTATNSKISWIVVNVANPAMILSGGLDNDAISPEKLLKTAGIAAGMYLILILLGMVLPRILGVCQEQRNIYSVLTIFGNIGFMGFPILSSMYGKEALLYGSIFIIFFNLLIYTYGIHVIQGAKAGKKEGALHTLRSILNPGVLACMGAMLLYVFHIPLPYCLSKTIEMLSSLTAPLSMMVIGASMKGISFRELLQDIRMLLFVGIRMIALPLLGIAVIRLFVTDSVMLGTCLVMFTVPAGSMVSMLAQQYQGDTGTASRGVVLTTILSVVTMPLVFWLVGL